MTVDSETPVAKKQLEYAETTINRKLQGIRNALNARWTCRVLEKSFDEMLIAIGDCLRDPATSVK
jgi:hypothetical protein